MSARESETNASWPGPAWSRSIPARSARRSRGRPSGSLLPARSPRRRARRGTDGTPVTRVPRWTVGTPVTRVPRWARVTSVRSRGRLARLERRTRHSPPANAIPKASWLADSAPTPAREPRVRGLHRPGSAVRCYAGRCSAGRERVRRGRPARPGHRPLPAGGARPSPREPRRSEIREHGVSTARGVSRRADRRGLDDPFGRAHVEMVGVEPPAEPCSESLIGHAQADVASADRHLGAHDVPRADRDVRVARDRRVELEPRRVGGRAVDAAVGFGADLLDRVGRVAAESDPTRHVGRPSDRARDGRLAPGRTHAGEVGVAAGRDVARPVRVPGIAGRLTPARRTRRASRSLRRRSPARRRRPSSGGVDDGRDRGTGSSRSWSGEAVACESVVPDARRDPSHLQTDRPAEESGRPAVGNAYETTSHVRRPRLAPTTA